MSDDDLYLGPTVLAPGPRQPSKAADLIARWIVVPLMLLIVVIVLVFYVFFSSAVVEGESMYPTLHSRDYLLITHGARSLSRGDVIVTNVMENGAPVELIKRVIALPGDTIEIKNDVAYVNGSAEPPRGQFIDPGFTVSRPPIVVPPGYLYVLGDNRPISEDSRYLGPVPISGLKGRAIVLFAPITRARLMTSAR